MHSLRSRARKHAWYNNGDDSIRTYNFFGRINTNQTRRGDIERGDGRVLTHISTENDAFSPVEAKRREDFGTDGDHSKRHGTFPNDANGSRPVSRQNGIAKHEEHDKEASLQGAVPASKTDDTIDDNTVGTRKRRKFHLPKFLGGHKDKDNRNLEHSDTHDTSKSKKNKHKKIPFMQQFRAVFASWINILLVFVPVGLAIEYSHANGILSFVMNFIAIIPLASMLSFATEELAYYVGDTFGGLLNATFGNATELIVSIIALVQNKVIIVKTSLIGSMLSNLLLVLGMCFFFGGINRKEQFFNITVAQTAASLLALAIGALVTPTAFRIFSDKDDGVQPLSHAASILLLLIYIAYLLFQLRTHIDMYSEASQKSEKTNLLKTKKDGSSTGSSTGNSTGNNVNVGKGMLNAGPSASAAPGRLTTDEVDAKAHQDTNSDKPSEEEEEHTPQLSATGALVTLAISTALIAVTSDGMVSGIDSIQGAITEEFIGLILVPIVGNAAEHATAVTVAIKDKMDLAIGVAVGSSLQIALLVIPIMVLLYWFGVGAPAPQDPMDLNFDGFQVVVLFIAIILVNYVIQDGRSHWLEGVMLFTTYLIFAVAAWYYPATSVPL